MGRGRPCFMYARTRYSVNNSSIKYILDILKTSERVRAHEYIYTMEHKDTSWADHKTNKYQVAITFEPRRFIQNREHRYNPPIKAQLQSHVANRLKLLCHSERLLASERASELDLYFASLMEKKCSIIEICGHICLSRTPKGICPSPRATAWTRACQ